MSRTILTSPLTLNASPGHVQEACNAIVNDYDCNGQSVTIQLSETEYQDQVEIATQPLGLHVFNIRGNPSNPGAVMWTPHATGACLRATDFGAVTVDGIEFGFYVSGANICVAAYQFGIIDIANCLFASCEGGVHISASYHGAVNIIGPYTLDGNAANHIYCTTLGKVNLGAHAVSMPHNLSFTEFCHVDSLGYVGIGGSPYSGPGAGSGTGGKKYSVTGNGVLKLNGVTFPGTSSGTIASGGQVL